MLQSRTRHLLRVAHHVRSHELTLVGVNFPALIMLARHDCRQRLTGGQDTACFDMSRLVDFSEQTFVSVAVHLQVTSRH